MQFYKRVKRVQYTCGFRGIPLHTLKEVGWVLLHDVHKRLCHVRCRFPRAHVCQGVCVEHEDVVVAMAVREEPRHDVFVVVGAVFKGRGWYQDEIGGGLVIHPVWGSVRMMDTVIATTYRKGAVVK